MKEFKRKSGTHFKQKSGTRKVAFVAHALLALSLSAVVAAHARAQDGRAQDERVAGATAAGAQRESEARGRAGNRGGLLRILNLTTEQRARIGAIRRETEPQGRLLGARLREARRALDEAIYSAAPDEAVIEERVRELGAAQTAFVRLRSLTELRIRRVLSPEQLDVFRRLQSETQTRRRRMDQLVTPQGDMPPRFRDRIERRRLEERRQRRLRNEQNAPPGTPRGPRPNHTGDVRP
jgi:Spy/CpxP family protein refolding chaperone